MKIRLSQFLSHRFSTLILFLSLGVFATGCVSGGKEADLVPVSAFDHLGPVGYCQTGSTGNFTVTVKNQGSANAAQSIVEVEFFPGGSKTAELLGPGPSLSLPPGVAWDVTIFDAPPSSCFDPDCDFRITVDSTNQVSESNKANNVADGRCIG